jgi:aminocarboxymuconate-semialdehyde decarboxylase
MFPSIEILGDRNAVRMAFSDQEPTRPVSPKLSDIGQRKEWLAKQRIDCQIVGGWLDIFGYELPPEEGADWCRFMNEHMHASASDISAFALLACVPLQSGKLAAEILEHALANGFHGAMIGTQPKGLGGVLDDPDLTPFWEAAHARKATLFIHPMYGCDDERLRTYGLVNALGRVTDTSVAVARLMHSGHLNKYSGATLVLSHGGAALPMVLGRLAKAYEAHPAGPADPSESFRRLYFDTVVFDVNALRLVCAMAGLEKVVLGTDYPFPIGDFEPMNIVNALYITDDERAAIAGKTAMRLFNIAAT